MWRLFRSHERRAALDAPEAPTPGRIRDHRLSPSGVMPQQAQAWLLIGIAAFLIAIIAFSGRSGARAVRVPPLTAPTEPNQARIEEYERRLADAAVRLRAEQDALTQAQQARGISRDDSKPSAHTDNATVHDRVDRSFWADNVAFTRRRDEHVTESVRLANATGDRTTPTE